MQHYSTTIIHDTKSMTKEEYYQKLREREYQQANAYQKRALDNKLF